MQLTFEKLIKFDLLKDFEKGTDSIFLIDFLGTMQEIISTDQFIRELPSYPGSTDKIIRSELISAIGATLAIENISLEKEEIEESFSKADRNEKLKRVEQEAENSRKVYRFIIDLVSGYKGDFKYSEQIIKQIHKYFTDGMNYVGNVPGDYRELSPRFGLEKRESLCKTKAETEKAMRNFVDWLNRPKSGILGASKVIEAIMAHYYLTEIHPFGNGNGRTARALEALVLYVGGMNTYCFWSLANFWSINKNEYLSHLGNIYLTSNPLDFLIWGIKGYRDELKRIKDLVLKKVKRLMLMDYAKYLFRNKKEQKIKINQRIIEILELLKAMDRIPMVKFTSHPVVRALYHNKSLPTQFRDFKVMEKLGLVKITKENDGIFIEANFQILDRLIYRV